MKGTAADLSHEPDTMSPDGSAFSAQTLSPWPIRLYEGSVAVDERSKTLMTVSPPPVTTKPDRQHISTLAPRNEMERYTTPFEASGVGGI